MIPITRKMAFIEPCKVADLEALSEAAKQEEHFVFNPTDTIWKDGEVAGYFSLGTVAPLWCWFSKKLSKRDTFYLINTMQQSIYRSGARGFLCPVPKDSPFNPEMSTMGFKNLGNYDFFLKEF